MIRDRQLAQDLRVAVQRYEAFAQQKREAEDHVRVLAALARSAFDDMQKVRRQAEEVGVWLPRK